MPDTPDWVDIRLSAYLEGVRSEPDGTLIIVVREATALSDEFDELRDTFHDEVELEMLRGSRQIISGAGDRKVEILFKRPVGYCVIDESYASPRDNPAPPGALSCHPKTYFLDYVREETWVDDDFLGGAKIEYTCVTLDQIVKVVTAIPPRFRVEPVLNESNAM